MSRLYFLRLLLTDIVEGRFVENECYIYGTEIPINHMILNAETDDVQYNLAIWAFLLDCLDAMPSWENG